MAQKTVVTYVDDLTGEESSEISTYTILVNGVGVEIDLAPDSYDLLLEALEPFLTAAEARRVRGERRPKNRRAQGTSSGPSSADIRAWAKEQGHDVNDRGRVSADLRSAYEAAH
ncbi:Lsr2 family protein [Streptomyces sp. NPDC058664]|uniref:histone-like nucleoid-structuring protein Lsr2 n=1 Tax=unclassified Streptomyces TaxID=2593676 RepID=UPI00365ED19C